jgi:hypothetical protein
MYILYSELHNHILYFQVINFPIHFISNLTPTNYKLRCENKIINRYFNIGKYTTPDICCSCILLHVHPLLGNMFVNKFPGR